MGSRRRVFRNSRAFTLVELMAVVSIVAILAVIAIVGFRKYLDYAHSAEAVNMVGAIKSAEEAYRAETLSYYNVSTNLKAYYPRTAVDDKKMAWGGAAGDNPDGWRRLNVTVDGPVMYGYAVVAGAPGVAPPSGDLEVTSKPTFPAAPAEPWYVIQAKGDINADGKYGYALGSSFTPDVYRENEGD
ncbi:MAG: prepilin-type N-terminal cleavage/methylation domain-containing protein [Deltaproteobacteria bacterium]|nr:prepilin-type N-terminal cleavage/methylation domain-containing protein [Deltaproteobacteria bacterium]